MQREDDVRELQEEVDRLRKKLDPNALNKNYPRNYSNKNNNDDDDVNRRDNNRGGHGNKREQGHDDRDDDDHNSMDDQGRDDR